MVILIWKMENLTTKVKLVYDFLSLEVQRLPVGMLLPSVTQIRNRLNVSQASVQRAFDILETMGKIKRVPGKGVFVDNPADVGEIAIVITPARLRPEESLYYSRMVAALAAEISCQTKNLHVRLHLGKDMELHEYTSEKYAASLGLMDRDTLLRLRGVITFVPLGELQNNLNSRGIPVCTVGADTKCSPRVCWNMESFWRGSLAYAVSRGLKNVSFFGYDGWTLNPERRITQLECLMKEYGFEPHPEWRVYVEKRMSEDVGYSLFHRLWESPSKPQLLIALDDVACAGMLKAVNEKGLKIPEDFQLITFANKGMRFPYNREITHYEVDSSLHAKKAVEMILGLLEKGVADKPKNVILEPTFIQGQTTR